MELNQLLIRVKKFIPGRCVDQLQPFELLHIVVLYLSINLFLLGQSLKKNFFAEITNLLEPCLQGTSGDLFLLFFAKDKPVTVA